MKQTFILILHEKQMILDTDEHIKIYTGENTDEWNTKPGDVTEMHSVALSISVKFIKS